MTLYSHFYFNNRNDLSEVAGDREYYNITLKQGGDLLPNQAVNAGDNIKDVKTVDIVLNFLKEQSWVEDEKPCLDQTISILNNVKNYTVWAVWIWNSMHHPVGTLYGSRYNVGSYDQCLNSPSTSADPKIITQYCLADMTLTGNNFENDDSVDRSVLGSTEPYIGLKTNIGRNLNKISWSTCLPSACKPGSISKILKAMYFANPLTPADPDINVAYCEVAGQKTKYSNGFFAFIIFIATSVFLSFFSTYYLQNSKSKCGVMNSIANSFCVKRNWITLTKKSNGDIGSLNFLKACLAAFFVAIHTTFFEIMAPISNGLWLDELLLETRNPLTNLIKHVDLPIDNFIMMSGLLLVMGLMHKKKSPALGLVNRYFRLTAAFAVVMFYVAAVSIYTGNGPFWRRFMEREQQACIDNWWLGILMLNNYVNCENICLIVSWYIPCDYQLAVMGTILFLIMQKKTTLSKIVCAIIIVLAVLMPGIITYWRKLPGTVLFRDVEKIIDFRQNEVYVDVYTRGHNRAGPYLIGMAMGYMMTKYKPDKYRNVISKKYSALILAVACVVSFKVATSTLAWVSLEYDRMFSALYAVLSRNLWAFTTCLTIAVVEYGSASGIRNFVSWHGFTILSRLAYGVYLTHSIILQQNLYSRRNLLQFDMFAELLQSFGVMIMSLIASTVLWMFVETPLNNIVNLFTNSGSKDVSKNENTADEKITSDAREINNDVNKLKGI